MTDWLDRKLIITKPSKHYTPKDIYAVTVGAKAMALCISCSIEYPGVAFLRNGNDDRTVGCSCQGCGTRQGRLL